MITGAPMQNVIKIVVDQVVSLAWLRCCMEEGVDFVNRHTQEVERDERKIYAAFENKTGEFEVPKARVSPTGFEKNILEVVGSYLLNVNNHQVHEIMQTPDFKSTMNRKIQELRR